VRDLRDRRTSQRYLVHQQSIYTSLDKCTWRLIQIHYQVALDPFQIESDFREPGAWAGAIVIHLLVRKGVTLPDRNEVESSLPHSIFYLALLEKCDLMT
jgi:hypothetical protein